MGVMLFVELEREIPDLADDLCGKALARVNTHLDALAVRLGLVAIEAMTSCSMEQIADLMGDDPNADLSGYEEEWFDPEEGRRTVRGLLDRLEAHPEEMRGWKVSPEYILGDLRDALAVFDGACQAQVRFHFTWAV